MTIMETRSTELPAWRASGRQQSAEILVSDASLAGLVRMAGPLAGFDTRITVLDADAEVPEAITKGAAVLVVEARRDSRPSIERLSDVLERRAAGTVIVALRDPSLDDARNLLRAGAADIISLPLQQSELEAALTHIRKDLETRPRVDARPTGKLVSMVKSIGGVGATALLTQIAAIYASREHQAGRETCLVDLDLQFGTAGLYLGSLPKLTLQDLLAAGARLDAAMLRSTTTQHVSGLHFITSPQDLMPLDSISEDQVATMLDLARHEFATIFLDLPPSWTNWSLSAMAHSDLILMITELSVAGLQQARRQLDFIKQQGISDVPLRIVMNRVEKRMFKRIDLSDAVRVLGRQVDFIVADDPTTMRGAVDQGLLVSDVDARSRVTKDIRAIADAVTALVAGAA